MTTQKHIVLSAGEIGQTLDRMAEEVLAGHQHLDNLVVVGIRTGGAFLAQRLADRMGRRVARTFPVGVLDITLYRDDWTRINHKPLVGKTELPGSIDEQEVLLVDDVLFTGRTVRAAMNELFDYGRPASISLVVLVERDGRQLPICAQHAGGRVEVPEGLRLRLKRGEDGRLSLELERAA